jgi:hypothetical protein
MNAFGEIGFESEFTECHYPHCADHRTLVVPITAAAITAAAMIAPPAPW